MTPRLCRALRGGCLAAVMTTTGPASPAAETTAPAPPHAATATAGPSLAQLVGDLGSPAYAARERASRELWKRGAAARAAVAAAAAGPDPEAARRARELLDRFDWGVFPDTPPDVVAGIRAFRSGQPDRQQEAVGDLLGRGPAGVAALRAVLSHDMPLDQRAALFDRLAARLRVEVPKLLFAGRLDEAQRLLELNTLGPSVTGVGDYAAFVVLRGTLPDAVARLEPVRRSSGPTAAPAALALAHLYRAAGDWPRARALAPAVPRPTGAPNLADSLLEEEGDWAELARRGYPGNVNNAAGLNLTLLRLAGRSAEYDAQAAELARDAREYSDADHVLEAAHALLLNNKVNEATDLLLATRQNPGLLFDLLSARMRYGDALRLLDEPAAAPHDPETGLRRARLLHTIGRRDEAVRVFNRVAESLRQNPERGRGSADPSSVARHLIRGEMRLGLKDLAAEHAALFVGGDAGTRNLFRHGESAFELLFGPDAAAAESCFWQLRHAAAATDAPPAVMKRVRDLFAGKATAAQVDEAVRLLRHADRLGESAAKARDASDGPPPSARTLKVNRLLALATVLRSASRWDEAERAYADAADAARPSDPGDDEEGGARSWVSTCPAGRCSRPGTRPRAGGGSTWRTGSRSGTSAPAGGFWRS